MYFIGLRQNLGKSRPKNINWPIQFDPHLVTDQSCRLQYFEEGKSSLLKSCHASRLPLFFEIKAHLCIFLQGDKMG
jgi:hypothetical protein